MRKKQIITKIKREQKHFLLKNITFTHKFYFDRDKIGLVKLEIDTECDNKLGCNVYSQLQPYNEIQDIYDLMNEHEDSIMNDIDEQILKRENKMAKLTTAARHKLKKSQFALPNEKKYPVEDAAHAKNAKARASQMVKKGKLSASAKKKIDAKANKVLHKGKKVKE